MVQIPGIPEQRIGLDVTGGASQSVSSAEQPGRNIAAIGTELQKAQQVSQEREATAYVSKTAAELQWGAMQDFKSLQSGDVNTYSDRFRDAYQSRLDTALATAPNDIAKEMMQSRAEAIFGGYADNVFNFQAQEKTRLQGLALEESANLHASTAAENPEMLPHILANIDADAENAGLSMLDSDVESYRRKSRAGAVGLAVAGQLNKPDYAEELLGKYGSDLDAETALRLRTSIASSREKIAGLMRTDPAEWVQKTTGAVAPEESITLQREAGIPEAGLRALTKTQASDAVTRIESIQSADEMKMLMSQLQEEHAGHFDILMRDLKGAGLKGDYQFAMGMDPVLDNDAMRAHFDVLKQGETAIREVAKQKMQLNGDRFTDLEVEVSELLEDVMDAQGLPAQYQAEMLNSVTNIAAYYYGKGGDIEDAAEKATQWLTDKYVVEEGVAIPNDPQLNPDRIVNQLETVRARFDAKKAKLQFTDKQKEIYTDPDTYAQSIRDKGGFITNIEGDGVYLVDGGKRIVFREDGNPVEFKFSDLSEEGRTWYDMIMGGWK